MSIIHSTIEHLIRCQRVLTALGKASTDSERTSVLKFASITFDHKEKAIHNLEIEAGVDVVLVAHLKRSIDEQNSVKQAERLCKLLCLIYQCTDNIVADSFYNVGATLVQCIFELLFKQTETRSELKYVQHLLCRISMVEISLQTIEDDKEILTFLLNVITEGKTETLVNHALSLLAGLSDHRDSKAIVMKFPKLFDAIVDITHHSQNVESRYQAIRVLRKLAWHVKNRALMGQRLKCVNALVAMSDACHPSLQAEATKAIQLLSIEYENKGMLVASTQGKLVLTLMKNIVVNKQKPLALRIILNLISRETYKLIGLQQDLINTLATLSTSKKEPEAIAAVAAQSLRRFATYAQVKDRFYEDLLRAMIQMSRSKRKDVAQWAAKAFLDQSVLVSSSFYIVRDQDFMESIADLITSPHREVKGSALETIVNLSEKRSNAKKLASSNYLITKLVDIVDGDKDAILRRHAVRAILSLVSHSSSTRRIAKHLGLVPALSKYGIAAQDNDVELKRAALHGVIILAPLL